jgi:hypothetical protein
MISQIDKSREQFYKMNTIQKRQYIVMLQKQYQGSNNKTIISLLNEFTQIYNAEAIRTTGKEQQNANNKPMRKGKKIVVFMIVCILLFDIIIIGILFALNYSIGNIAEAISNLPQDIFRFGLECILCVFLYKGHRWAKWITIVLFVLAGIVAGIFIIILPISPIVFFLLIFGITYLIFAGVLLFSRSVKMFLNRKRVRSQTVI